MRPSDSHTIRTSKDSRSKITFLSSTYESINVNSSQGISTRDLNSMSLRIGSLELDLSLWGG